MLIFHSYRSFLYHTLFHPTREWGCNFSRTSKGLLGFEGTMSLPGHRGACLKYKCEIRTCLCPQASLTLWPAVGSARLIVVILNTQINCKDNWGVCVGKIFPDWQVSIQNAKECFHSLHETSLFSWLICNIRFSSSVINGKQSLREVQQ